MKVPHWRFSCFLNCTKNTKSRNMSRIPSYLKKWQKTNEFPSYIQVNRNRMLFSINPIQMVFFGAAHGWGAKKVPPPLLKICHTYHTMMKFGSYTLPKEDPKTIWITWHTPWVLLTSAFFNQKSANFAMSRNTDIDSI